MSEAVEAAAKAGFNAEYDDVEDHDTWEELSEETRDRFRQIHGVALAAAAPLIQQDVRQATADEIAAKINARRQARPAGSTAFSVSEDMAWITGMDEAERIARRVGGGGGGGQ
jgi:hypothetical protein